MSLDLKFIFQARMQVLMIFVNFSDLKARKIFPWCGSVVTDVISTLRTFQASGRGGTRMLFPMYTMPSEKVLNLQVPE